MPRLMIFPEGSLLCLSLSRGLRPTDCCVGYSVPPGTRSSQGGAVPSGSFLGNRRLGSVAKSALPAAFSGDSLFLRKSAEGARACGLFVSPREIFLSCGGSPDPQLSS